MFSAELLGAYLASSSLGMTFGAKEDAIETRNLWRSEPRTSIGKDDELGAAKDGQIFSLRHVRLQPRCRLVATWEVMSGDDHPALAPLKSGKAWTLSLGGELRAVVAKQAPASLQASPVLPELTTIRGGRVYFRLYVSTPMHLDGGWRFGGDRLEPQGLDIQLEAAALGKHIGIGGYDIRNHRERPIRRFVPAGSVYYLSAPASQIDDVRKLHGTAVGDDPYLRAQGFGVVYVGNSQEPPQADSTQSGGANV